MNYKILYGLIDQGSSGLLLITDDRYVAYAISTGIMDSEISPIFKWDQENWRLDMSEEMISSIIANWDDWCALGKTEFKLFEQSENKSYNKFKYKKNLAQIRRPVTELLIDSARYYDRQYEIGFSDGGYETIPEILKDPQLIKSYAKAINATTMVANQELIMTYESNKDMRARVYISYHHYLSKINKIATKEEADILIDELSSGFVYGHNLE